MSRRHKPNNLQDECTKRFLVTDGFQIPWWAMRISPLTRAKPDYPPNVQSSDIAEPFSQHERELVGAGFRARGRFIFPQAFAERSGVSVDEFFERCDALRETRARDEIDRKMRRLRDLVVDPTQRPNASDIAFVRTNERELRAQGWGETVDAVLAAARPEDEDTIERQDPPDVSNPGGETSDPRPSEPSDGDATAGPTPPGDTPTCARAVEQAERAEDVPARCRGGEAFRRKFATSNAPSSGDSSPDRRRDTDSGAAASPVAAGSAEDSRPLSGLVPDDVQTLTTTVVVGLVVVLAIQLTDVFN
jgi:hypothetical protein